MMLTLALSRAYTPVPAQSPKGGASRLQAWTSPAQSPPWQWCSTQLLRSVISRQRSSTLLAPLRSSTRALRSLPHSCGLLVQRPSPSVPSTRVGRTGDGPEGNGGAWQSQDQSAAHASLPVAPSPMR
jgi:hypothetical protein